MRYKHKKRGTLYDVIGTGFIQTDKPLIDGDRIVSYMGLLGDVWARGFEEFHDGRFEQVEVSKKDTLDTRNDAGVVQVYFRAVKMAREYGLKIACRWEEGVFRLYKGDVMLGATVDIMHLIVMIEDEITEMGL